MPIDPTARKRTKKRAFLSGLRQECSDAWTCERQTLLRATIQTEEETISSCRLFPHFSSNQQTAKKYRLLLTSSNASEQLYCYHRSTRPLSISIYGHLKKPSSNCLHFHSHSGRSINKNSNRQKHHRNAASFRAEYQLSQIRSDISGSKLDSAIRN